MYFVMEYIPGRDLEKVLQQRKSAGEQLPVSEILRIGRSVADALDYAHQNGVIHRDVKPANVILADDGRVVLTDFGLAMDLSQGTMGEVFGSPHYIAPEQARSSSQAVPQSDIYSLGVMCYEMLAGALPFDDPSPTALVYQLIHQEPPSPQQFNPDLGPSVAAVLLKALRKSPQERYATGRAFIRDLAKALDEELPETQPVKAVKAVEVSTVSPETAPLNPLRPATLPVQAQTPAGPTGPQDPYFPQAVPVPQPAQPAAARGGGRCAIAAAVLVVLVLLGAAVLGARAAFSAIDRGAADPHPNHAFRSGPGCPPA